MISKQFLEIIESLKSADLSKINRSINNFIEKCSPDLFNSPKYEAYKKEIEENFYIALSKFLALRKFEDFRRLFNHSDKLGIFIDVKKIPFRFRIICDLHLLCMQTGQNGNIFEIIRFYNQYNLFDKEFSDEDLKLIENIKNDKTLIANLRDLFGKVTDSLIFYSCIIMPHDLYVLFSYRSDSYRSDSSSSSRNDELYWRNYYNLGFLLKSFDKYSMYGLSVEKLGDVQDFVNRFEKNHFIAKNEANNNDLKLIEFQFSGKTHLISVKNILQNRDKIIRNKDQYEFYSLSMVLLGGIGPQGHGFTYSTPRGEIVEICSDIKENEAIIIKYKEFLKQQFLTRLKKELTYKTIKDTIIKKIMDFLSEFIKEKEKINYYKKERIMEQIKRFLKKNLEPYYKKELEFQALINKISNAVEIILRPIKMSDQFICRMELIEEGKLNSKDIAKLTSLKDKSHYDILRERFYFQNEIMWFYNLYSEELLKRGNQLGQTED